MALGSISINKFRETFFQFGCLLHAGLDVISDWISSSRAWIEHIGNECRMKINACTHSLLDNHEQMKDVHICEIDSQEHFHLFEGTKDVAQKKDRSLWELEHWFVPSCWNPLLNFEFQHVVTKFVHEHETFACWHSCSFQNLSVTMNWNV